MGAARSPTLTVVLVAAVGLAACTSSNAATSSGSGKTLSLVAYSVAKPAYDALQKGFASSRRGLRCRLAIVVRCERGSESSGAEWTEGGLRRLLASAGSDPAGAEVRCLPTGTADPRRGLVSESVVVIAVRKGNPKKITGWDDLVKSGVKIVTPDPGSSGSAKWNILAAYSHVLARGGTDAEAEAYLKKFFANVVSKPDSGAKATQTFLNGTGDVLISYENEAIAARQKGQSLDYIVPAESILIENPAAVTVTAPQAAKDFLAYVESCGRSEDPSQQGIPSSACPVHQVTSGGGRERPSQAVSERCPAGDRSLIWVAGARSTRSTSTRAPGWCPGSRRTRNDPGDRRRAPRCRLAHGAEPRVGRSDAATHSRPAWVSARRCCG